MLRIEVGLHIQQFGSVIPPSHLSRVFRLGTGDYATLLMDW